MKISVITVVYNNREYIEDSIKSVLNQSYSNIEYIVVDGGSTDGTVDIIKKYDDYISTWVSEPDRGIYDAMNKGIGLASGDIIGFLNADDVYFDNSVLNNIILVMKDINIDACFADLVYVNPHELNKVVRYWRSQKFELGLFKKGWVPAHPTFYVRKKVYDHYGNFDLNFKLAADYELMARFLEYCRIGVAYIPKIFVKMRIGGATNKNLKNIIKQNFEIFQACKKNRIRMPIVPFILRKSFNRVCQFCSISEKL